MSKGPCTVKIEILNVEQKTYTKVDVNHLLPHGRKQLYQYRRYSSTRWTCWWGDHGGWHPVTDTEMLEEEYQKWLRKERHDKTVLSGR